MFFILKEEQQSDKVNLDIDKVEEVSKTKQIIIFSIISQLY